jgi:hypothetical protein
MLWHHSVRHARRAEPYDFALLWAVIAVLWLLALTIWLAWSVNS